MALTYDFDPYEEGVYRNIHEQKVEQTPPESLSKSAQPGYTLAGIPYVVAVDPERGFVLQKAGMTWEQFKPQAEAMHKKANESEDPCWEGYEAVGLKRKGGKTVPNCVPKS